MANWPDAMRVISDETQALIDGWNDGGTVGGMGWDEGANEVAIEALLARYGLELSDEGYAVLAEDADEDDASIQGGDDEPDETQELIDQVNDPDCPTVGPFVKGANPDALLDWLFGRGVVISEMTDRAVLADDSIAGDEDELSWCATCKEFTLMTPLTDAIAEEPLDPDFPMLLCEGCGYTTPAGYEPEPKHTPDGQS